MNGQNKILNNFRLKRTPIHMYRNQGIPLFVAVVDTTSKRIRDSKTKECRHICFKGVSIADVIGAGVNNPAIV